VSENKVLCHPASADSLTTSAGMEDHVSMGGYAARKLLEVVANVEHGKELHDLNASVDKTTVKVTLFIFVG